MRYIAVMTNALATGDTRKTDANETVASNIRAELARVNSKPAELARLLGENEMWLSRRLGNKVAFSTNDVQQIADILGVSVGTLFEERRRASGGALGVRTLYLVDEVGPAGIEPTTSTVESGQLAPVIDITSRKAS